MDTLYKVVLSFHVIAIISWMAGVLYLYRLLIYHTEETEGVVMARFRVMEERLYRIITIPAMGVAFIAGLFLLAFRPELLRQGWLHGKLLLVLLLLGSTVYAGRVMRELAEGRKRLTSRQLRILNEVPTLLMIGIVFLVILKPFAR